ncbi:ferredoxin reductase [Williamsia maris]|uniref:Ferredoxin-NADP reductase n=2 Tax=Williamsia maris TaxID=72806 RepID=A0ABT1H943_9NOCA|nr:FAD-binding oxidoreductase [Williamsia maris]MCP2174482.1 Ferredoxin-NADP reductase [Williamsia maris]
MLDRFPAMLGSVIEAALAPHPVDRYLELVDPMITWTDLRGRVVDVRRDTARTVTLTLAPTRQWSGFRAGQYIQLSTVIKGVRHTRCFSPANAECGPDGFIELTITAHDDGFVSRHLRDHAAIGDVMGLQPATGDFVLPQRRPEQTVFISGGSGITPVLSMLRTLVAERHTGSTVFIHYATTPADAVYADELQAIAAANPSISVHTVFTRHTDTDGPNGHFSPEHLTELAPDFARAQTFLCGPAGLMDAVREFYTERDLDDALHSEAFTAPSLAPDPDEPVSGTLSFKSSGRSADNDGHTILEQAEAAGLSPEFGCRMGICFSCSAVKKSGCTRNVLTGDVDTDSDTHIQLCISAPVGDVEIDI